MLLLKELSKPDGRYFRMARAHPSCDRHPNLQMIRLPSQGAFEFEYVCLVPGCGCRFGDGVYYDAPVQSKPTKLQAVRAELLKVINEELRLRGLK